MNEQKIDTTRDRILDQAERLFATKGYGSVSVREITGAARSNLAAVNYHFGNKHNLYLEVFRERWMERTRRVRENFEEQISGRGNLTVRDVVEALTRAFLDGPLTDEELNCHIQLMQRELAHPGEALEMVVEEVMKPYQELLGKLIQSSLPFHVEEDRLRLSILGILGMTIYFNFARPAVSKVLRREYDKRFKSELIEHITQFAVNGLNNLKKET